MGFEFEENDFHFKESISKQPFLIRTLIRTGIAKDEKGANAALFSTSLVCIAASFVILFTLVFPDVWRREPTIMERQELQQELQRKIEDRIRSHNSHMQL